MHLSHPVSSRAVATLWFGLMASCSAVGTVTGPTDTPRDVPVAADVENADADTDADTDAATDAAADATVEDRADVPGMDVPTKTPDVFVADVTDARATADVTDVPERVDVTDVVDVPVTPDVPATPDVPVTVTCTGLPTGPLSATRVFDGVAGALDLTFDGRGNVVLAVGRVVHIDARGAPTTRLTGVGTPYQLRFATTGDLFLGNAANVQRVSASGAVSTLSASGSPYGLAVDGSDRVWFVNYSVGTVSRTTAEGAASVVVRDVPNPIYLAFGVTPDTLYVGSGTGGGPAALYRVTLRTDASGAVSAGAAERVATLTSGITGLALDLCGNVYVTQAYAGRLVRVDPVTGSVTTLVTGLNGIRGGAFGAGAGFDARALYVVSADTGVVYSVPVGVLGVAHPMPRM